MREAPGYLLPDGDAFTADLACCLVFYPDKPEYRRALTGSLAYLSTWLAWERDSAKRGKDAARAWKNALDETLECMNMACLEDLISDVERIRILMENKKDCCDGNTSYYPPTIPPTTIEPGNGDPPDYYGETAVSDWDDWAEHVCYNAHKYVDYMKGTAGQLNQAVLLSTIYIGVIAAALVLLSFVGIGLAIAYGTAAAIVAGIALGATISTFEDTADSLEAARDEIVCAIVNGSSLPDAIENALSSGSDWDLFYQFVDYASAIAIMYEGGYETEYLPSETRDDCDCAVPVVFRFTWPTDINGWVGVQNSILWNAGEYIEINPANTGQWKFDRFWTWNDLETEFSFSLPVTYDQVQFKFRFSSGTGSPIHWLFTTRIYDGSDVAEISEEYDSDDWTPDEWHTAIWNLSGVMTSGTTNKAIAIRVFRYSSAANGQRLELDYWGAHKK